MPLAQLLFSREGEGAEGLQRHFVNAAGLSLAVNFQTSLHKWILPNKRCNQLRLGSDLDGFCRPNLMSGDLAEAWPCHQAAYLVP